MTGTQVGVAASLLGEQRAGHAGKDLVRSLMGAQDHSAAMVALLTTMIEGASQEPLWGSFLQTLIDVTSADIALLVLHPPGRPMDNGQQLGAGIADLAGIKELYAKHFSPLNRGSPRNQVGVSRSGRRSGGQIGSPEAFHDELREYLGLSSVMRLTVNEGNGVHAWLTLGRYRGQLCKNDGSLLRGLSKPLGNILTNYVAQEKARFNSILANEAVRRMRCGWILLDSEGYILATDEFGSNALATSGCLAQGANGKLAVSGLAAEVEVLQAVRTMAVDLHARPKAISLNTDPWLDMLLLPAKRNSLTVASEPAVIAYVHSDNWKSSDRCSQLVDLFGLSRSEASLTMAICRGRSIAESAAEAGISVETARSYTKLIYAKTGTRGIADLVRTIMGSVLALAPDI